jgi:hypothetical protein
MSVASFSLQRRLQGVAAKDQTTFRPRRLTYIRTLYDTRTIGDAHQLFPVQCSRSHRRVAHTGMSAKCRDTHGHITTSRSDEATPARKTDATGLVKVIRESTARFRDVSVAEAEDYHLLFGCVSGPDAG